PFKTLCLFNYALMIRQDYDITSSLRRGALQSVLEKDVQELKQVDHSSIMLASIRSQVPSVVNEYLRSSLGVTLQKVLQKHTEELIQQHSLKDVSEIIKTKQERAAKEQLPTHTAKPYDQTDVDKLDRVFPRQPNHRKRDNGDDKDEDRSARPNQGKNTKKKRTKESESSKKSSTSKGNTSPKASKSNKLVHAEESVDVPTEEVIMDAANDNVVNDVDQPQDDLVPKTDTALRNYWFKQPLRPHTPDLKWNTF
nr:hypothetical protein [Tanacetum cinerariifolium]